MLVESWNVILSGWLMFLFVLVFFVFLMDCMSVDQHPSSNYSLIYIYIYMRYVKIYRVYIGFPYFTVAIVCFHIKLYRQFNVEIFLNHIYCSLNLRDILSYPLTGDDVFALRQNNVINWSIANVSGEEKYQHIIFCILFVLLKRVWNQITHFETYSPCQMILGLP